MALLTVQNASNGAAVTLAAAAAGDQIAGGTRAGGWDLGVVLIVRNANATLSRDVTVAGHAQVTVPLAGTAVIPVFAGTYAMVRDITYSTIADLTVAAVRVSAGS